MKRIPERWGSTLWNIAFLLVYAPLFIFCMLPALAVTKFLDLFRDNGA